MNWVRVERVRGFGLEVCGTGMFGKFLGFWVKDTTREDVVPFAFLDILTHQLPFGPLYIDTRRV